MKQTKKICSLFLALLCAASLLCTPAFAANSSTDGGGSGDSGVMYLVPVSSTYSFFGIDGFKEYVDFEFIDDGFKLTSSYPGTFDNGNHDRSVSLEVEYIFNVPVPGKICFSGTFGGEIFRFDTGEVCLGYCDASFSSAWYYGNSVSSSDDVIRPAAWTLIKDESYSYILNADNVGKYRVKFVLNLDSWRGAESRFKCTLGGPQFKLFPGSLDSVRNPKDYFSAGKKAFFACPNCGTQMNQTYNKYVGVVYSNQSLECPSCGKVITNKSWMGGLIHKHSESGGDHQGTLGPDAPVQTPSGTTNIPYPDGTSKPVNYTNAYTENNVTYIYTDDRVVEYYPSALTGNGDVYVTYEYGGDTYITVQNYTPPSCSHTYDEGVINPAPTCTAPGKLTQTCTQCGDKKVSVLPTVSHSYGEGVRVEPTCLISGTLTQTCSICNDKKVATIPNLGHDWQVKQTVNTQYGEDGTLIKQGYVLYECTRCQEQYKSDIVDGGVTPPPDGGGGSGGGGSGGDSGGGDSGGGSGGDDGQKTIWERLGEFLGTVLGGALDVIGSAIGKILDILTQIVTDLVEDIKNLVNSILESFTVFLDFGGGFKDFLSSFFSWLPPEIVALFVMSISLGIVLMIIKFIRG